MLVLVTGVFCQAHYITISYFSARRQHLSWSIKSMVITTILGCVLQCESKKSSPPKTFCNIFTLAKCISVKFCEFIASIYRHMFTSFGQFNLIFNKMALIFLGVLIVFTVSSFEFHQVRLP